MSGRAKRGRLTRSADFERVYRQGRSHGNRYFVLYAFPRTGEGEARLGVSVSRKVGGAVDRNRVKRVLREAFWSLGERLPEGHDFVIVARPAINDLLEREGMAGVKANLEEALERRGGERST